MIDWTALGAALVKAARDIAANVAPTPKPALTGAQIAVALAALQTEIPTWQAALAAHQGFIAGADDLLAALGAAGVPGAAAIDAGVDALPDALSEARAWLPWILPWLGGAVAKAPALGAPATSRGR